ncbi:unnamed protein product [Cochlearia groenlandica]
MAAAAAAGEEKILVSVRVRPLNEKEKTKNDRCDWECVNNTTILCKSHNLPDNKSSFTYDKVFGFESPTKQVYDDGAKEVALCVLSGINSSIFAYGQTSSGKTYTMSGITEFAMDDIFVYIDKHKQERKFTLKFSAMEIYNEAVRDLLCEDSNTPLRLLDDPERGTVVEKLKEEIITDRNHLGELLSICETQRKIGETCLNETSSRSHQILRLTIESSRREMSSESSAILAASVCFVDLAGSERASQTLSAGSRLKEGCHINRSLLTLGTVIRKLSKGRNNGHIPYRDSKLTRILQNSLGGNARTAIICTMSPARSHLEQSRNTLLFASCAKEVTTNAQVNMVVSQKALVKQLQRELARMANELKNLLPSSSSSSSSNSEFYVLLKQKEELIAKMEEQIQELKWQRDVAQSQVDNLLKSTAEERSSSSSTDKRRRISYDSTDFDETHMLSNLGKSNFYSPDDSFLLDQDTTPQFPQQDFGDKWEEISQCNTQEQEEPCKEVRCIEVNTIKEEDEEEEERVQILDEIVDKKVEFLSSEWRQKCIEALADEKSMESRMEDIDSSLKGSDIELSLSAKLEAEDEVTKEKVVEEVQEIEQPMEKHSQTTKKQDMEHDDMSVEHKQNYESFNADEKEAMESEKERVDSSIETIDMKLILHDDKLEDKDELATNKYQESQETEKCVDEDETTKDDTKQNSPIDEPEKHVQVYEDSDKDDNTYESLKKKVKELQKTIEYFMSIQSSEEKQSPSFNMISENTSPGDYYKMRRSRSCRDNLLFTKAVSGSSSGQHLLYKNSNNTSFDTDNTLSIDAQSTKDSDTETSNSSFHEFIEGLKEMAMKHSSTHEDTETKEINQENREESGTKAEFERQQSRILELWGVCNVPLVHRTYFFLLFKGEPSDFIYMEVEQRRLSFLKDSTDTLPKQTAKSLSREREWLAKQIPKKYGKKEREELYKKWCVELNSKQRSMQVSNKIWSNSKDVEHCKESASLVATLAGFVDSKITPKEMFGLSFSPITINVNKSSGWRLSNSFSRISFT